MSVRAELARLGLRWLMKPGTAPGVTSPRRRERIANFERWVRASSGMDPWRDQLDAPAAGERAQGDPIARDGVSL